MSEGESLGGARAVVDQLCALGVRHIFGIPGSTETPILEVLRERGGVEYVLGLHEGVVVAMAEGYARIAGVGTAMLHTVPGSLNGAGQVFNALKNRTPVVVLAGHKDRVVLAEDGFCATPDLPGMMRPVTKWSWQTLAADALPGDLSRAYHAARTPVPGPAYLTMPIDLLAGPCDAPTVAQPRTHRLLSLEVPAGQLDELARFLEGATNPVIVAGNRAAGIVEELRAVSDRFDVPVATAPGTDLTVLPFPMADDRFVGGWAPAAEPFRSADVVLAVGCRAFFPYSQEQWPRLPRGARLAHVDSDPLEVGWSEQTDIGVVGNPGAILAALAHAGTAPTGASGGSPGPRVRERRAAYLDRRTAVRSAGGPGAGAGRSLTARHVGDALHDLLPPDAIIVDEAVRSSRYVQQSLEVGEHQEMYFNRGGALGWGVPAAIGMKIARPDRPVVAVVGDGAFQFSSQAVWTAVQQRAPVVAIVMENGGYLAVKRHIEELLQVDHDVRWHPGTVIADVDHAAMSRSYGAAGVDVTTPDDLASALKDALASDRTTVIVAHVEQARP